MKRRLLVVLGLLLACNDVSVPTDPRDGPAIGAIEIVPDIVEVREGAHVQLQLQAFDAHGVRVNRSVTPSWSAADPGIATVDALGRLEGRTAGATQVTATVEGVKATAAVAVLPGVSSIEVEPAELEILTGEAVTLEVVARDSAGAVLDTPDVRWSTSANLVAMVTATGKVTGRSRGTAIITAEIGGQTAVSTVHVDWGPVVALAIEPSKALVYVSDQLDLVPRAYDRGGNRVPAPAVSWSVDDADIATVDPSGRLRALRDGDVRVTATAGTHMATANIQVRTPAGVFISEIAPARLTPGVVAAIRGSGFNAQIDANEVTIDGEPATIVAATTTELMVRLPAAGAEACLPTRDAKIHVRVSYPDTVLAGDLLHPYSTTPQLNLVAGEAARFLAPDFAGCVELPVTGGRYILSLFNTSTASSSLASVSLEGVTADSTAAPAVISVAASRISVSAPRDSELEQGARLHHAILESNQEIARLGGAGRMVGPDLAAAIAEPPAPGEIVDLRVPSLNNLCSQYTPVAGRVVYSGTRAVILEDPANPNAGHMDHVYHAIGQEFDQDMWPVLLANFGDPLAYNHQLHGDGRIYMLFTRRVQEMGGSGLAGFVTTADFSSRANCPSSDQREISYLAAPDSVSDVDEWHRRIRSTVIHEGKHITSYAERYSQGAGGVTEVLWLEESTAMIAEELWVREIFGYRQHGATQYIDGMWCEVRGCTKDDPWVMVDHFAFLSRYMEQVEILSPIWGSDPNSTYYGSGWALVRWVVDRYASSEAAFLRELTQQHTATDIDNLLDRAGTTFPEILADWTLALAAGRYRGFTPHDAAQTFPSWDLRDVYAGLKADFNAVGGWFDSPYPLSVREAGYGNFRIDVPQIRAGSAAFIEISGDQTSPQVLRLGGSDGVPATILMSIMRID